jgi:hypothetical protein
VAGPISSVQRHEPHHAAGARFPELVSLAVGVAVPVKSGWIKGGDPAGASKG